MKKFLALFLLVPSICAFGADWPVWRGVSADGVSTEKGWKPAGIKKKLWERRVGKGYSAISVVGDKIYTLGNIKGEDNVLCLDAATGKVVWTFKYASPGKGGYAGPKATPVVCDGRVYTLSDGGLAHCLDAATGRKIWSADLSTFGVKPPTWRCAGSPLVVGGTVYFNVGDHGVALRCKDGKKLWASPGVGGYATPVLLSRGKSAYLAIFAKTALKIVNPATGKELAAAPWKTKYDVNAADPVIVPPNGLFVTSGYGKAGALFRFNGKSLAKAWENKSVKSQFSSPVFKGGCIFGVDGHTGQKNAALVCLDAASGKERWRDSSLGYGSFIFADGKIIYLNDRGVLTIGGVDASGFKKIISERVLKGGGKCWTMPVLANKLLYCRGSNGKLVCLDLR